MLKKWGRERERKKINTHTGGEKVAVGRRLLLLELIVAIHPNLDTHSDTCWLVFFMWEANPLLWVCCGKKVLQTD